MQRIKYLIIVATVMMFWSGIKGQNTSKNIREEAFERGVELFEKGKYAAAQKTFKAFYRINA